MKKRVAVFGATGSIGRQAAEVILAHRDELEPVLLTAHASGAELLELARRLGVRRAILSDPAAAAAVAPAACAAGIDLAVGEETLARAAAAEGIDLVVNAVVGAAGARVTLAALAAGRDVALANKESLVVAGELVRGLLRPGGPRLFPIDSEHASARVLVEAAGGAAGGSARVRRLILTASGGPFLRRARETFDAITPEEALRHPTWEMGPRITIDSATLMNKGLEVIEAVHLFGLGLDRIEVAIHPQSIVHAMVETTGGTILAELAPPDMRLPIRSALLDGRDFADSPLKLARLDLSALRLDFETPRRGDFPCLDLAIRAARTGGTAPAVLNAADEVAVAAFLDRRISFPAIAETIEIALAAHEARPLASYEDVAWADAWARTYAADRIARRPAAAR